MTSGGSSANGAGPRQKKGGVEHAQGGRAALVRLPGKQGGIARGLALPLVARALEKLLLLVLAHLLAALLDYAAHSDTSASEMREDV